MPTSRDHFVRLARYNVWATQRLLGEHIAALSDHDYRRDAGLFFKSIHGTLNHLLVAEQEMWFPRFAHGVSPQRALDEEVESDRAALSSRLLAATGQWEPLIASWDEAHFDSLLNYRAGDGTPHSLPFGPTLAHVFNHGTHHRGQISAALTAMGRAAPVLDMVRMLQAEQRR